MGSASAVDALVRATERPQDFLSASKQAADVAQRALLAAQELFERAVRDQTRALGPLDALHVDGFDDEQIWAELELRNAPVISYVRRAVEHPQVCRRVCALAAKRAMPAHRAPLSAGCERA